MIPAQPLAIRAESLVKDYHTDWKGRIWRALDGISVAVPRGSVCGLVGPNGSGKTTTLKILAGLAVPSSGSCQLDGGPVADAVAAGQVGFASETAGLPGFLTGREFLRGLARLSGCSTRNVDTAVASALALTGLDEAADRRVKDYSKGMRQKLVLAQAVLGDPAIVLLDEPASGLDPRATERLGRTITELRTRGRTVVLSSHFLPQIEEWCDQFVMLDRGRIIFTGDHNSVTVAGGLSHIYLERTTA
jgi:ABC-type multidrug transport system ATPase subunit